MELNWFSKSILKTAEPTGLCYKEAARLAIEIDGTLVHGIVTRLDPVYMNGTYELVPKEMQHAWVEKDGKVMDVTINIGVDNPWDKHRYYKAMKAKPLATYSTTHEIVANLMRHNRWGPWDDPKLESPI